mmetsp:Transcript_45004/g.106115  ORF Transcript_45004/g.106115 Transcript_45004/m.106115 type:complete len:262 (+) Transcript_45004:645-1430(+)
MQPRASSRSPPPPLRRRRSPRDDPPTSNDPGVLALLPYARSSSGRVRTMASGLHASPALHDAVSRRARPHALAGHPLPRDRPPCRRHGQREKVSPWRLQHPVTSVRRSTRQCPANIPPTGPRPTRTYWLWALLPPVRPSSLSSSTRTTSPPTPRTHPPHSNVKTLTPISTRGGRYPTPRCLLSSSPRFLSHVPSAAKRRLERRSISDATNRPRRQRPTPNTRPEPTRATKHFVLFVLMLRNIHVWAIVPICSIKTMFTTCH